MGTGTGILVLGAYGLAGRAIVERFVAGTGHSVVAAGRSPAKLEALLKNVGSDRVCALTLDATDRAALRTACAEVSFVINAVGPFARSGADIARTVIESGRPYLDCANEQSHYRRLAELDALARERRVPLVTAAGAIPGISTLVMARLLEDCPVAVELDCCWAQFRHAYADSGLASIMGGILEAASRPETLCGGTFTPVVIGRSLRHFELPEPFGRQRMLEVPTIDNLTLPKRFSLREMHTWFYMGDMPTWLLGLVRLLQPGRRPWAYRLIETIMRRVNDHDTQKALASGVGPEALLIVHARGDAGESRKTALVFRDGAVATACLPVFIASCFLSGEMDRPGLSTPLDIISSKELSHITEDAVLGPIADYP